MPDFSPSLLTNQHPFPIEILLLIKPDLLFNVRIKL